MANRRKTELMVVHVTATPPSWDHGASRIDQIHKGLGWSGIGYNEVIRRDGTLETGRGVNAVGAHVAGFNSVSYGIALVGGVDDNGRPQNNMTDAQFATLERRLRELSKKWPKAKICGHRDLSPDKDGDGVIEPHEYMKACPCFDAIPWAASKGLPAADIKGTWTRPDGTVRGPDARNAYLQRLLAHAGYQFGPIDGRIGTKTRTAIRAYQKARGLKVNGTFDAPTVKALRAQFEKQQAERPVKTIEKPKPVVPKEVEAAVEKPVTFWQRATGAAGAVGAGGAAIAGVDWQTVAVIGGMALVFLVVLIVFRRQIGNAVRDVREAVEQ